MSYYVGLLAGTILIIATNAGLIGVSRLTYSMGVHRQFPDFLRTVHPTCRTPWVAIVVYTFAAIGMIGAAKLAGGQGVAFLGNLYAFGAMLSFTIAHASVIALRVRKGKRDPEQPFRAPLNIRIGELDIPLFADARRHSGRLPRSSSSRRCSRRCAGPASAGSRSAWSSTSSTASARACR